VIGPDLTDAELIRRSVDDPDSFRELFTRHYGEVRRYTQRVAGLDVGEELAAQTFLVAFERRERFDAKFESARPWLFGIAHNMVRHHLRDEARRTTALARLHLQDALDDALDEEALTAAWASPRLVDAFASLQDQERECFLLVVLGDLSYDETASILGIPSGTVRSKIHRVRAKLRELLPNLRETQDEDHGRELAKRKDPKDLR